jgi:hypothetical protein
LKYNEPIDFNAPRVKPAEQDIKIKCRYCDLRDICKRRAVKEQYENAGWITRCRITPNRPGKKRKAKKRK